MNELISIVLPVYNGEKYLRESIDSIIAQTYSNWELLILDDCSFDGTHDISLEYSKLDSRIKYFHNEYNLKLPRNLNKGFSIAKGDYLTWTSDDNIYLPSALEIMLNTLKENNADFAYASCRIINENGEPIEYIMVSEKNKSYIVGKDFVGACFLYSRNVLNEVGEYDPDLMLVEDFDYWQRIFSRFKTIAIEEILYKYRFHDGALTSTMNKKTFNTNLEKMLLKNKNLFGKLNFKQKYYFYCGLNDCRVNMECSVNPYVNLYRFYSCMYFVCVRVPNKLKRIYKNVLEKIKK